jgi:ISXO2-like transposase domain
MTDEGGAAKKVGSEFALHGSVNHSIGEYVRGDVHTNTIEGYFSIMKRGIYGTFHHISQQHLKRYLAEFDFRYNERSRRGEWLARNFTNGSVHFDVEREAHISLDEAKEFNRKFEYVDLVSTEKRRLNGEVKHRTLVQYTKVAKALGPHEKIAFGLYRGDAEKPYRYANLTKRDAELLAGHLAEEVTYRGSIHGAIHDVGIEELWFHLRRSGSLDLVRCGFREPLYKEVHEACEHRHARVYIHGLITVRRVDREIIRVRAEKIKVAPRMTEDRYQSFFGADPNYTEQLSSEEFVERNRYEH